jgi:hypothetical protein
MPSTGSSSSQLLLPSPPPPLPLLLLPLLPSASLSLPLAPPLLPPLPGRAGAAGTMRCTSLKTTLHSGHVFSPVRAQRTMQPLQKTCPHAVTRDGCW